MRITLTSEHIDYADNIGACRRGHAFVKNRKNHNGLIGSFDKLLHADRLGARCELAGKLFMNPIRWHALSDKISGLPDLGNFIDVKGVERPHHSLIVQKDDEEDFAFLLVDGSLHPDYLIVGWIWGREAKSDRFWKDPTGHRPAFFVARSSLRPATELLSIVHPAAQAAAE